MNSTSVSYNFKWQNIHVITVPKGEGRGRRKIFEKVMAKYLPNLIQEAEQNLGTSSMKASYIKVHYNQTAET